MGDAARDAAAWNRKDDPCDAAAKYARRLERILDELQRLRGRRPTALRLTNLYNAVIGNHVDPSWDRPDAVAPSRAASEQMVTVQCRLVESRGGMCIDVHRAFNGPDGRLPAKRFLATDYTHPGPTGHATIAKLLARAGIGPVDLVGTWATTNRCRPLVAALRKAGLEEYIGQMLTGQYRDEPAKQIAADSRPCRGARSFEHSHRFEPNGKFASLDEGGNHVDEGTYTVRGDLLNPHASALHDGGALPRQGGTEPPSTWSSRPAADRSAAAMQWRWGSPRSSRAAIGAAMLRKAGSRYTQLAAGPTAPRRGINRAAHA